MKARKGENSTENNDIATNIVALSGLDTVQNSENRRTDNRKRGRLLRQRDARVFT